MIWLYQDSAGEKANLKQSTCRKIALKRLNYKSVCKKKNKK